MPDVPGLSGGSPRPAGMKRLEAGPLLDVQPQSAIGVKHSKTFTLKQVRRDVRALRGHPELATAVEEAGRWRPRTRAQCGTARPCPWVGCKWHLYLDVTPAGGLQVNHPGKELEELEATCALDVADQGGVTLERTGQLMNLTRERIRQVEEECLRVMRRRVDKD
jgi:hypothetical protein